MNDEELRDRLLSEDLADEYASWFRCLADGTRVRILSFIAAANGPVTVGDMVDAIGRSQSTVSKHLQLLAEDEFVFLTRDGVRTLISVNTTCMKALPELAALLIGVSFLVQLIQRRLGSERVRQWMGGRPVSAALKGIAVGFVTPFCTFTAVPLWLALRKAGVPAAGYVAFIVAAPVLDPVLFGALVLIVGMKAAIVYLAVAFSAAMLLALLAEARDVARHLKPLDSVIPARTTARVIGEVKVGSGMGGGTDDVAAECSSAPDNGPWLGLAAGSKSSAEAAMGLAKSFGPMLVLGVAIGLGIEAFISAEAAARITGNDSTFSIPIAALLDTPLYFSTELFVPIADSLRGAGVGIGAIVALTIAGAGANVPEFVILSRLAKPRIIVTFALYICGVAIVGGLLTQAIVT